MNESFFPSAKHSSKEFAALRDEALARLCWGESEDDVGDWLSQQSPRLTPQDREAIISECQERLRSARVAAGWRPLSIGVLLLCLGLGSFFLLTFAFNWLRNLGVPHVEKLFPYLLTASLILLAAGTYALTRALDFFFQSGGT